MTAHPRLLAALGSLLPDRMAATCAALVIFLRCMKEDGDMLYTPPAPDADFDPTDYGSSAETQALIEVLLSHELYLRRQPPLTLAPPFPFYGPQIRTYTEEELESLLE